MLLSYSTDKAINWLKNHVLPSGGIEAWEGYGRPYPEVSGYLIPTLLKYKEYCGDGLINSLGCYVFDVQAPNGGYHGIDGVIRSFDTGACLEGLEAYAESGLPHKYKEWLHLGNISRSIRKTRGFLENFRFKDMSVDNFGGRLIKSADDIGTHYYTCRVDGVLQNPDTERMWGINNFHPRLVEKACRTHYIAYWLEGLYKCGLEIKPVLEEFTKVIGLGLMPYNVFYRGGYIHWQEGIDTTATFQFAIHYWNCGMEDIATSLFMGGLKFMQDDGGIRLNREDSKCKSWTIKYFLDANALISAS